MKRMTRLLWADQDLHPGDRHRLFHAVGEVFEIRTVLYPGSFVDVAASFVFDDVTYVDNDPRAATFFDDEAGVAEIVRGHRADDRGVWRFLPLDYTMALPLPTDAFDLLVSLYAGFVSEHCTEYLKPGGLLLVNPSHGDAAMASIDHRYELAAVVKAAQGAYALTTTGLDRYLIPAEPIDVTRDLLHATGRGIAYTAPASAYVFRRF